jgi:hypothetical protein
MISNLPQREEYLRKKRNKKLLRWGIIFLIFIFLVSLASYLSHRPKVRISKIELTGGVLVTQADVESKSLSFVQGSYLWLFPKNNVLWYPHKALAQYLQNTFKRIDTINIHLKDFHTLAIEITERKPVAMWCDTLSGVSNPESKCYFMDQNSTIFSEAPTFSGDAYFKYYGLVPATSTPIGLEYMASTTKFTEVSHFVEQVRGLGIRPQYLLGKDNNEFSLVIAGGGEIYFDTKESLTKVFENLSALLATPALSTTSTSVVPVQYIDMRYGNKLFYKLK